MKSELVEALNELEEKVNSRLYNRYDKYIVQELFEQFELKLTRFEDTVDDFVNEVKILREALTESEDTIKNTRH